MLIHLTYFTEIMQRQPTYQEYTDTSELGDSGVWLNLNEDGEHFVWRLEWPHDIQDDLVSFTKLDSWITNSDLKLSAFVLHKATLHAVCSSPYWRAPNIGRNNTPIAAWIFKDVANINPAVVNLLHICSIVHNNTSIIPAIFYHPSTLKTMTDDASWWFDLSHKQTMSFLSCKCYSYSLIVHG